MKLNILSVVIWLGLTTMGQGQQVANSALPGGNETSSSESSAYIVLGTTLEREKILRNQIQVMQPAVLPTRIIFVPHWQYLYAAKTCHLHVPTGMTSKMFTHLPSRSVYIDADYFGGNDWMGHWIAHELGHLEKNNADENQAEKAAAIYRNRLEHLSR